MNDNHSSMVMNQMCHDSLMVAEVQKQAASELMRPSYLYKPRLFIDGNQWCALFGENVQDGVAGFGNSPNEAMYDFDKEWYSPLATVKGVNMNTPEAYTYITFNASQFNYDYYIKTGIRLNLAG